MNFGEECRIFPFPGNQEGKIYGLIWKPQLKSGHPFNTPATRAAQGEWIVHHTGEFTKSRSC